jgi:GNAT superfamily N-acetyltransferase
LIREATLDDLETLMPICEEMYRLSESKRFGLGYDLESAQNFVAHHIDKEDRACFVAERDGFIVGTIGLSCWPWDLDDSQKIATEEWWYVDPTERGGNLEKALLGIAKVWAKSKGATCLRMAALKNNHRGMGAIYRRRKFDLMYSFFAKEI